MATAFPVIDLRHGQVVRAVRGQRNSYRPIVSGLCSSSDPVGVARMLCQRCPGQRLYVADLDALQGAAPQLEVLRTLLQALPEVQLWLDAGFADVLAAASLRRQLGPPAWRVLPVFASESLRSRAALQACVGDDMALSLDRRDGQRLDPAGCWDAPDLWPARLIVMTLERVGAEAGPDLDTIAAVRRQAPRALLIGAGGIRHAADLADASRAGADAWLVASALHDGRL